MSELKEMRACYRVVVKGIVRDEQNRILFVRERSETWDLPGGGLEHGESIITALTREFKEEIAAKVSIDGKKVGLYPTWNTKFDAPVLIVAYEADLDGEPSTSEDVSEFKFFSLDEAKKASLDSTLPNVIEQLFTVK